jgi:hypothetical protein
LENQEAVKIARIDRHIARKAAAAGNWRVEADEWQVVGFPYTGFPYPGVTEPSVSPHYV